MIKKIFVALLLFASVQVIAQNKVGTIDSEIILSKMPELAKVQEDLKAYSTKLELELQAKIDDFQAKVNAYKDGNASMTEPMKILKQEEMIDLENDINKYRQNGSQLVQIEQNRLLNPLYQKIGNALKEVAKAEGFSQVLNVSNSGIAYMDSKFDVTNSVMIKLGIPLE